MSIREGRSSREIASTTTLIAITATVLSAFVMQAQEPSSPAHQHNPEGGPVLMLTRDLESRLAVNALPKPLQADASVRVLQQNGYIEVHHGTNPFTCIVSRRGGNLYPVCFDVEGTRTILPAFEDDALIRLHDATSQEAERQLAEGFADGRYQPPSRPGIAYMLSPATYLLKDGKLTRSLPHTMFYAPYLTNADIGGILGQTAFVDRPGPDGMIIVVAGDKERQALLTESQSLVDEVENQIGLKGKASPTPSRPPMPSVANLPNFPGVRWQEADPQELGWSAEKLEMAHRYFTTLPPGSIVIVDRGKIVAAWGDPARRIKVSSVRKSLLSALIGIAVAKGQLDLNETLGQLGVDDQPPLTPGEKQATVQMLLESRSGVYHSFVGGSPALRAIIPERGSHVPGTFWAYNNWDFNTLGAIYEKELHTSIGESFRKLIAEPLQMEDFEPEDAYYIRAAPDDPPQEKSIFPEYPFRLSARDLARFSYLYLQHGNWNGSQIVPADWISESTRAHSAVGDGRGYGYLWWTNSLHLQINTFEAFGSLAKYVFVVPDRGLVVAYLNHAEFPDNASRLPQAELNALPAPSTKQLSELITMLLDAQQEHRAKQPDPAVVGGPLGNHDK